jgi:hypothetical protein
MYPWAISAAAAMGPATKNQNVAVAGVNFSFIRRNVSILPRFFGGDGSVDSTRLSLLICIFYYLMHNFSLIVLLIYESVV